MAYKQPKGPGTIHGWTTQRGFRNTDSEWWGARLVFWVALFVAFVLLTGRAAHAGEMTVRPFLMYQHQSDILRGPPFFKSAYEPTNDYAAIGATFEWPRVALDVSHGFKSIDCAYLIAHTPCKWQSGSLKVTVRYYILGATVKTLLLTPPGADGPQHRIEVDDPANGLRIARESAEARYVDIFEDTPGPEGAVKWVAQVPTSWMIANGDD